MGKLSEYIAEAAIKINPEKVLTKLTQIDDLTQIATLVSSGKKDDRFSIAANPNLNIAQQTKLSTDKVDVVKHALCFNANLDPDIARSLLKEDIERLPLIALYGKKQVVPVVLEFLSDQRVDNTYKVIQNLINAPEVSEEVIEYVIKNAPDQLTNPGTRGIYTNKTMTKNTAMMLLDHLKDVEYKGDATLSRLIINNPQFIKEADVRKLDWQHNSEVQCAISSREDFSAKFVSDMLDNLVEDAHLEVDNPHMLDIDNVNKVMEKYLTFKMSYKQNFLLFKNAMDLPLNPKLMIEMVKAMQKQKYDQYAKFFLKNKFFPSYGLDEIDVAENFRDILSSPATDVKRAEELIKKVMVDSTTAESVLWGLVERKEMLNIGKVTLQNILNVIGSKTLWFEYLVSGDKADEVIDNLDKYSKYFTDYNYKSSTPKFNVLSSMVKNKNLTSVQRKKMLDAYNNLDPKEILPYTNFISALATNDKKDQDPEFFRSIMTEHGGKIWDVWNISFGTVYYQFNDKIREVIDEVALTTNNIPSNIFKLDGGKNFSGWVAFNNKEDSHMSDETAIKYLIHFIKDGDDKVRKVFLTDNFIDTKWLTPEIKMVIYGVTDDVNYLPDDAKDIFLF